MIHPDLLKAHKTLTDIAKAQTQLGQLLLQTRNQIAYTLVPEPDLNDPEEVEEEVEEEEEEEEAPAPTPGLEVTDPRRFIVTAPKISSPYQFSVWWRQNVPSRTIVELQPGFEYPSMDFGTPDSKQSAVLWPSDIAESGGEIDLTILRQQPNVSGGAKIKGVGLHPELNGVISFEGADIYTRHEHDKSPLRTVGECRDLTVSLLECSLRPSPGATTYDGFGMMWGAVLHGVTLNVHKTRTAAAREWGIYAMNCRDMRVSRFSNETKAVDWHDKLVGCGRGLVKHENRIPEPADPGCVGGQPSEGEIVFERNTATCCGWEGMNKGLEAQGGSALTVGGHTGHLVQITENNLVSNYCGGIAVWGETHYTEKSNTNPEAVRCWTINSVGVPVLPAGPYGHATALVHVYGNTWRGRLGNRTPILAAGMSALEMGRNVHADLGSPVETSVGYQEFFPAPEIANL